MSVEVTSRAPRGTAAAEAPVPIRAGAPPRSRFGQAPSWPARQRNQATPKAIAWTGGVVLAAVVLAQPLLATDYVLSAILVPFLALSLAGIGQNLITGYTGQLSVGSAAFMSVGAFAAYDLHLHARSAPLLLTFAFGGLVAALAGALFGLPSLRIRGFYLVVSTLAAQFFVEWLFTKVGWFSGDSASGVITAPPLVVAGVDFSSPGGHYWLSLLVVVPLTLLARNLVRSRVGRSWMAVRDMEIAAAVVGVDTHRAKLLAFAVSSLYCGVAGALFAFAYLGTVEPHGFDLDRSFQVLFIVILGGMGSVAGPFLGAAFVILFPIALDNLASAVVGGSVDPSVLQNVEKIIFGSLVIFFLVKQPAGLARLAETGWTRACRAVSRA
jgi:branched-chain amino acid transport system permease protein